MTDKMSSFVFALPNNTDYTGLLSGQYLQVCATIKGAKHTRYFSPVSKPDDFGKVEVVIRYETSGVMSHFFKSLTKGDQLSFRGPCGGFEYFPSTLQSLILIASGGGITPGLQLIRSIHSNPEDTTNITLVYYSESYDDILYRKELDDIAAKDKRLSVHHTLGEVPENWDGDEGFITTEMLEKSIDTCIPGGKQKIVICGSPSMSISSLYSLKTLGVPSDKLFIYGQFGSEQIRAVYGPNAKLSCHRSDNVF